MTNDECRDEEPAESRISDRVNRTEWDRIKKRGLEL
jgi:hypothetical protein